MTEPAGPAYPPGVAQAAAAEYPLAALALPDLDLEAGSYRLRFARTARDLDAILRLRYEVFNLELGEGLDASHRSGRDEDELDRRFHHLMILIRDEGRVVGTYRMQTAEMAGSGGGFYADDEFDLSGIPGELMATAVEIGRASVAKEYRNGRVLHLLWRGLAAYLSWNRKHFLFGCCSVNSQDPAVGLAVHRELERRGVVDPSLGVTPNPGYECLPDRPPAALPAPHVPALFQTYLTLGAKVAGAPALDRRFKTIDWLVALDVRSFHPATFRTFFR